MKFFLLLLLPWQLLAQQNAIVLKNVNIIDVVKGKVIANQYVLIEGNKIKKISTKAFSAKESTIINATGKYLMPGLWDCFIYVVDAEQDHYPFYNMLIAHGVTGVRDAGTLRDLKQVEKLQNEIAEGNLLAPRLFYNGRYINGVNLEQVSHNYLKSRPSLQSKNAEQAVRYVDSLAAIGVDYISIGGYLPVEIVTRIIAEAKKYKLPVACYVSAFSYTKASEIGINLIEHFTSFHRGVSLKREEYYARNLNTSRPIVPDEEYAYYKSLIDTRDTSFYNQSLQTMAKNKTYVVTHFAGLGISRNAFDLTDTSRRRYLSAKQSEDLSALIKERERQLQKNDMRASEADAKRLLAGIYDLHKAGVQLLAGSQAGGGDLFPGIWIHDELFYMVKAGLTPAEALITATLNPAKFMRRQNVLGTVEKGKLADLVLLDANPLADINNTRKINAVVANGRLLQRKDLDKLLEDAKEKAKTPK